ncbi:MAG: serine hydrolase, partial [Xanthomonadales bacterium]|nr:beta-lactamase family protein [Xanthomonadales bacterium]NIX11844.1 serine hydrolase [Xanthomonadales bacterium]
MVAAAFRDGEPLWVDGFGLANLEFGVPNTPSTPFNAGSIAKQFTATAILTLEQAGRLRLDDPVRR